MDTDEWGNAAGLQEDIMTDMIDAGLDPGAQSFGEVQIGDLVQRLLHVDDGEGIPTLAHQIPGRRSVISSPFVLVSRMFPQDAKTMAKL